VLTCIHFIIRLVPKGGSSSIKSVLRPGRRIDLKQMQKDEVDNYEIFTVIRDPVERFFSAYSTIMRRVKGRIAYCNGKHIHASYAIPERGNSTDIKDEEFLQRWREHFVESIDIWVNGIETSGGFDNSSCAWNEHIIPQTKFLMGSNISHIGCLPNLNSTLDRMDLPKAVVTRNSYEHNKHMPSQKFQSSHLISDKTKNKIRKLYVQDINLYNTFCKEYS